MKYHTTFGRMLLAATVALVTANEASARRRRGYAGGGRGSWGANLGGFGNYSGNGYCYGS